MSDTRPLVDHFADRAVVYLTGEVDLAVERKVLEGYRDAVGLMDRPHLIVDVSGVTFMDSTGLNTLATALRVVEPRGGTISVVGAGERITRLLHIVGLDASIDVPPVGGRDQTLQRSRSPH